ncbi:MAG: 30S ribosomal protein S8e [Thermoproteales archaeon]|nr:30S ribosomal protein S8e [Thermoproteales archaeon]
MTIYHGNDLRKISGGRKGRHVKVKRKYLMGRFPVNTHVGHEEKRDIIKTFGGNIKIKIKVATKANVIDPVSRQAKPARIIRVIENPASRDLERRGIITKGAILQTELGLARVVSRPGQDGVINAILIKE